jgi:hypothetical protein
MTYRGEYYEAIREASNIFRTHGASTQIQLKYGDDKWDTIFRTIHPSYVTEEENMILEYCDDNSDHVVEYLSFFLLRLHRNYFSCYEEYKARRSTEKEGPIETEVSFITNNGKWASSTGSHVIGSIYSIPYTYQLRITK